MGSNSELDVRAAGTAAAAEACARLPDFCACLAAGFARFAALPVLDSVPFALAVLLECVRALLVVALSALVLVVVALLVRLELARGGVLPGVVALALLAGG